MKRFQGFSLTELMIAVVIVAILGSVAIPSYQDSVRRARRADAKTVLFEASQWMERNNTDTGSYRKKRNPSSGAVENLQTDLSNSYYRCSPQTSIPLPISSCPSATTYYQLSVAFDPDPTKNTFTLSAAPTSLGDQNNDKCKTLTLTDQGLKGLSGSSASVDDCWGR